MAQERDGQERWGLLCCTVRMTKVDSHQLCVLKGTMEDSNMRKEELMLCKWLPGLPDSMALGTEKSGLRQGSRTGRQVYLVGVTRLGSPSKSPLNTKKWI